MTGVRHGRTDEMKTDVGLQRADGVESIEERRKCSVANEIIDTAFTDDLGGLCSGLLQASVAGEVSTEDMDVWTFAYFCDHYLLSRRLVANQTDNKILRVL